MSEPDYAYDEDDYDPRDCPNCGGEGYVANCIEEYACIDPESGCDLCMCRCDWCNAPPVKPEAERRDAPWMRQRG